MKMLQSLTKGLAKYVGVTSPLTPTVWKWVYRCRFSTTIIPVEGEELCQIQEGLVPNNIFSYSTIFESLNMF